MKTVPWQNMVDLFFPSIVEQLRGKGVSILHQATCPICNRQRVNVYYRDRVWKCNKCWNKEA